MSSPISQINPAARPTPAAGSAAEAERAAAKPSAAVAIKEQRSRLNAAIVASSETAAIRAGNEPLALLYRSAIEQINEALKPTLGENAIENAMNQDNSPEGTAGRIVALSTGFFEAFKQQHPNEPEDEVLKKFMDTIRGGFEQGFNEARTILEGLGVFDGGIADSINRTYQLVQEGYAAFEKERSGAGTGTESA
ncbi:MAG: DUF5610 domain-containing protein [Sinimarinibacterium sp.]|jgi:hypothetical protein